MSNADYANRVAHFPAGRLKRRLGLLIEPPRTPRRGFVHLDRGELIRTGWDEHIGKAPGNLRFLIQRVRHEERHVKKYGEIPWGLGLLKPAA